MENGDIPPEIDTSRPHSARMYDYFLGGKDNFVADRETADKALVAWPAMRTAARENRAFLGRAVRYLTEEAGISQFLDVGSGLQGKPQGRSVYIEADMREPEKILAHPVTRETLDFTKFAPATVEAGRAYTRGGVNVIGRDHDVFADLVFRGLTLMPPGVVVVSEWRPRPHAFQPPRADVSNNGAVARKP